MPDLRSIDVVQGQADLAPSGRYPKGELQRSVWRHAQRYLSTAGKPLEETWPTTRALRPDGYVHSNSWPAISVARSAAADGWASASFKGRCSRQRSAG
jgi:hypothetical protein